MTIVMTNNKYKQAEKNRDNKLFPSDITCMVRLIGIILFAFGLAIAAILTY